MSDHIVNHMEPHPWRFAWPLIIIALLLAFGLGRLWGRSVEGRGPEITPEPPGAAEAEKVTEKLLGDGASDGVWLPEEDAAFIASLGPLGKERRHRQLSAFAGRVNSGKLRIQFPKSNVPPSCVNLCSPATDSGSPGKVPGRTLNQ